jgi:hypothetical protein
MTSTERKMKIRIELAHANKPKFGEAGVFALGSEIWVADEQEADRRAAEFRDSNNDYWRSVGRDDLTDYILLGRGWRIIMPWEGEGWTEIDGVKFKF